MLFKNLIYYQLNDNYLNCFLYNLELCKKYNDVDICCIIPKNFQEKIPPNVHYFCPEEFDHRSTAKYQIINWENFEKYDNFLYLDSDAFVKKSLKPLFNIVENNPDYIHGVKELHNLSDGDHFFRTTKNTYDANCAFNAGTFAFNKKFKNEFSELMSFIKKPENVFIYEQFGEQPHFNEYFAGIKRIIKPTLSSFIYLGGRNSSFNNLSNRVCTNMISFDDALIVHYLGGWGCNGDGKLNLAQEELNA